MRAAGKILQDPKAALRAIRKGERIFISTGAAAPSFLIEEMVREHSHFADNEILHLSTLTKAPYLEEKYANAFRHNALFIGQNARTAVNSLCSSYTPVFLSEIPRLFLSRRLAPGACLIQVGPGTRSDTYNLGVSVDVIRAAMKASRLVIAQLNPRMPRTHGDTEVSGSEIDYIIPYEVELPEFPPDPETVLAHHIAQNVSSLIEDGSTLQLGIGRMPDAIAAALTDKNDLGIHSEMISDGVMQLCRSGNINGSRKSLDAGKTITSFAMGSRELYDFLHDNGDVHFRETSYVNDPAVISRQHRMVAINSAIEVDLTGQVSADSIGRFLYSGIGGQVDFIRGASMAPEGIPIIALPSTAGDGKVSRIVTRLSPGSSVVTTRADVHYVVTEFGIADLWGKTLEERALSLIEIAHPEFRAQLLEEAKRERLARPNQPLYTLDSELQRTLSEFNRLPDGRTLSVRPIRPSDEKQLQEFFYSHDPASVYNRYGIFKKHMHHNEAVTRVTIRSDENMALLALLKGPYGVRICGIGRFNRVGESSEAEVGVIVGEEYRRLGIARMLMLKLEVSARVMGIKKLIYNILPSNSGMLATFKKVYPGRPPVRNEDFMVATVEML